MRYSAMECEVPHMALQLTTPPWMRWACSLTAALPLALLLVPGRAEPVESNNARPTVSVLTAYLEDEPVYTSSDPARPGLLNEIVQVMAERMDLTLHRVYMPWKRAQWVAESQPNALIFPLTRTPEREARYRWLCPLFEIPVVFAGKRPEQIANDLEAARHMRGIGVIEGTPQEAFLREQAVPYRALPAIELYEALQHDELFSIYTAEPEARSAWRSAAHDTPLYFGQPLQWLPLWIAASQESPAVDTAHWCDTLTTLRQDGSYDRILRRYFEP